MPSRAIKIVVLTGAELRHDYFFRYLSDCPEVELVGVWREGLEKSLGVQFVAAENEMEARASHVAKREEDERRFFEGPLSQFKRVVPIYDIPKGTINRDENVDTIELLRPDLLIAFGCSLVRSRLLEGYLGRFINLHLGLSPWYRGSGTNYWAMVNGELEGVGATVMHINSGIDSGEIIHQIRARVEPGDTPHSIGHRLIMDATHVCGDLIRKFDHLDRMNSIEEHSIAGKIYRLSDFSEESVRVLYEQFDGGLIEAYLKDQKSRDARYPLIEQPGIIRGGRK